MIEVLASATEFIGVQIHPFVLHLFPQTLDEHIIPPDSASVHAEVIPLFFDSVPKRMRTELTVLVGVHPPTQEATAVKPWGSTNLRLALASKRLLQHINRIIASNVIATVEVKTLRLTQSTTAVRKRTLWPS
jgi:hypothetical protein